ncbi:hypothetical protein [Sporobacter termitidis]|uniref:hypothetical protein n=1 Tax=Sporobacter termitidis TaxID=44749 RepID=UPI0013562D94|nr:hypothetical protein [Sporobacter termitidis]
MNKDKIIAWVDQLIDSYQWESEMNIDERSSDNAKDTDELNKECEKLKQEIRAMLAE